MKRIAIYPGSFDPVTIGHQELVKKALPLFDEIIIAVGLNSEKSGYFPIEKRLAWLHQTFAAYPQVSVQHYQGLTIEFCKKVGAQFILRGLRSNADFEYERGIALANATLGPSIETVFLISSAGLSAVSSSIVREIHRHNGNATPFIPQEIDLSL